MSDYKILRGTYRAQTPPWLCQCVNVAGKDRTSAQRTTLPLPYTYSVSQTPCSFLTIFSQTFGNL